MNKPEDYAAYTQFWEPEDFEAARRLILNTPEWDSFTVKTVQDLLTPEVDAHIDFYGRALEIGCGVGRLMLPMASIFNTVVGIDISKGMIRLSEAYLGDTPNVLTRLCNGETFDFPTDHFDFVYSVICFQHIPYRSMIQQYLKETHRVLRNGGVVRIQTHKGRSNGKFREWVGHFYPTIEMFAQEFTDAGLTVIEKNEVDTYFWITAVKNECEL